MDGCDFPLRHVCRCGSVDGTIQVKGGQNVVYCKFCGKHAGFNAPKNETGEPKRKLASGRDCVPLQKATEVKHRDYYRCVCCGKGEPEVNLQVGHVLSVKDAKAAGLGEDEFNDAENLITQCEACNSGLSEKSFTARFFLALLIRRYAPVAPLAAPTGGLTVEWEHCSKCRKMLPKTGTYDCGCAG